MKTAALPFRRVFITGALVSALSLSALMAVSAQEATETPAAPETTTTQAERGFLGVQVADSDGGAVVRAVLSGAPGEAAGLVEGDIITAVNGEAVDSAKAVADAIGALAAGDTVSLDVTRGAESLTLEATLGLASDFQTQSAASSGDGFVLPSQRDFVLRFGADDQAWGVVGLSEDAPLYEAGLRSGDLITAIDGSMYDPFDLLAYVAGLDADANLTLEVVRAGDTVEVTVPAAAFVESTVMGRGVMQMFGGGNQGMMPFGQMLPGREGMLNIMPGYGNRVLNGWLGVSFVTLDEDVAAERNASLTDGALIVEVEADSPAALAGLQAEDVVTAVNAEPVDAERTLRDRLIAYEAGDTITLTINRGGEVQEIQVTLGEPVALQMGQMFGMPGMGQGNGHGWGQGGNGMHGYGQQNQPPAQPEATPETTGANA